VTDSDDPFAIPAAPPKQVQLQLPPPVSANAYWRSRIITPKATAENPKPAPFVSTHVSHEAVAYKEGVAWAAKSAGVRTPMSCRVRVEIWIYPARPQDWQTRQRKDPLYWADTVRRVDVDNASKVTLDALKGVVIGDDKQVWELHSTIMEPDEKEARLVVRITPLLKDPLPEPQGALL
jgi:crossover junction endodeoxyribonuclease RusA